MGTIIVPGLAILTTVETDFNCPSPDCEHLFTEDDWYKKYDRSKSGFFRLKCPDCGTKIEGTTDMKGDVVVWEKDKAGA